jgi:hypothetical protein
MSSLNHIISNHDPHYLSNLKNLLALPSVFTDREGIKQAIQYCRERLEENLPGWHIYITDVLSRLNTVSIA